MSFTSSLYENSQELFGISWLPATCTEVAVSIEEVNVARLRKRRGIPKGSITKLTTKITEIQEAIGDSDVKDTAQRYKEKLIALDTEFRTQHCHIVDVVDDEGVLADVQAILDEHDDVVGQLMAKLYKIIKANSTSCGHGARDIQSRKLTHLHRTIESVSAEIRAVPEESEDVYLV